jgi:hypothetical protein
VHSARKWLTGEAIPTQERLQILSTWLGISPSWLRYGEIESLNAEEAPQPGTSEIDALMRDIRILPPNSREAVTGLIALLLERMSSGQQPFEHAISRKQEQRTPAPIKSFR